MNVADLRPLPSRRVPAALLRWLGEPPEALPGLAEAGGLRVDDGLSSGQGQHSLWAFLPMAGRPDPWAMAMAWAQERLQVPADRVKFPGVLIFPGSVEEKRDGWQVESSPLVEAPAPELPRQREVVATGYVAAGLRGCTEQSLAGRWEIAKGRTIPLLRLQPAGAVRPPMRNADVLGRRHELERPELAAVIESHLVESGAARLTGSLGVGKTHAAWQRARRHQLFCWLDLGRELPGPRLAERLLRALGETSPPPANDAEADAARILEGLAGHRAAKGSAGARGQRPLVVIDDAHLLGPADRALLDLVLPVAAADGLARFLLVESIGAGPSTRPAIPTVVVDRFGESQAAAWANGLIARLEVPGALRDHWLQAAGACPWAFEEMLHALVHQGAMRRVFGSFFYAGAADTEPAVSVRFRASVAAAFADRGLRLAAQLLAVAEEPVHPIQLIEAAAPFGVDLSWGFEAPLIVADLVQIAPGGGLQLVVPAMARALAEGLRPDGVLSLRHALGGALAESGGHSGLAAYRLLAGSREALPTLLDCGRDAQGGRGAQSRGAREEVYNALYTEYRERRFGDIATEFEILWLLLPLARRLGCLARLERELDRAIELAADDSQRLVALVALRAEHDQDRGRAREAERGFRGALAASEGLDEKSRAVLLTRLGALLHRQGRTGEARDIFESLLEVVDRDGPTPLGATCLFFLGNIALARFRVAEAAELHARAAAVRRGRGGPTALAASLTAQGTVAMALGDYPGALVFAEEAQQLLAGADSEPDQLGYALLCRGRALARLGDLTGGLRDFRRVIGLRQGRDDAAGESLGRLELAQSLLQLGQPAKALDEARRAHFYLTMAGQSCLLGDAEQLLARIAIGQGRLEEAAARLAEALAIHRRQQDGPGLLQGRALALQLALQREHREEIVQQTAALVRGLDEGGRGGGDQEILDYWVFRGLSWLDRQGIAGPDPMIYLRRAYQEILRKANFLDPGRRHAFLYQIADHQAILDAATDREISMPILIARQAG